MKNQVAESMIAIVGALLVATAVAWAGSQGGVKISGLPLFALAGAFAFLVQWVVFLPSYLAQTEHYYDLIGSLTYLTLAIGTLFLVGGFDARSILLTLLVSIWALRLGSFLFLRVRRRGIDERSDAIKPSFTRFRVTPRDTWRRSLPPGTRGMATLLQSRTPTPPAYSNDAPSAHAAPPDRYSSAHPRSPVCAVDARIENLREHVQDRARVFLYCEIHGICLMIKPCGSSVGTTPVPLIP